MERVPPHRVAFADRSVAAPNLRPGDYASFAIDHALGLVDRHGRGERKVRTRRDRAERFRGFRTHEEHLRWRLAQALDRERPGFEIGGKRTVGTDHEQIGRDRVDEFEYLLEGCADLHVD